MGELGNDWQDGGVRRDARESEPSMEDILSSIKRIIAEDEAPTERRGRVQKASLARMAAPAAGARDDVLELNQPMAEATAEPAASPEPVAAATREEPAVPASAPQAASETTPARAELVSAAAAVASRSKLDELSRLVVKPDTAGSDTLEGLVREMLRPMLAEWLDANLPQLVEEMVAKEISRITGSTPR